MKPQERRAGAILVCARSSAVAIALVTMPVAACPAHGQASSSRIAVDLELALAVDTSASVDGAEYRLQMEGLVRAFRDPAVVAAIHGTGPAGIAVTLYHWSSAGEQEQIVPWTQLTDAVSADAFAAGIAASYGRRFADSTGIGDALRFGAVLIRQNRFEGRRKSIDVSGDGRNNSGVPPDITREKVIAAGITINGLAILNDEPYLHRYYARSVIGGPGAFVMTVAGYDDIVNGMRAKLLREISISVADNRDSKVKAAREVAKNTLPATAPKPQGGKAASPLL